MELANTLGTSHYSFFLDVIYVYMTLRGTLQMHSEAIGTILSSSSSYILQKKDDDRNYDFGTGLDELIRAFFSESALFYDMEPTRSLCCRLIAT